MSKRPPQQSSTLNNPIVFGQLYGTREGRNSCFCLTRLTVERPGDAASIVSFNPRANSAADAWAPRRVGRCAMLRPYLHRALAAGINASTFRVLTADALMASRTRDNVVDGTDTSHRCASCRVSVIFSESSGVKGRARREGSKPVVKHPRLNPWSREHA